MFKYKLPANMNIREAKNSDAKQLASLFYKHATYEGSSLSVNENTIVDRLTKYHPVQIIVVELNGELKGYMSVIKQFSTWDMEYYLYMDCLYLEPELRGKGLGQQLMTICKKLTHKNKVKEIQWQTPVENESAIGFYEKLGAINKPKQRFFW